MGTRFQRFWSGISRNSPSAFPRCGRFDDLQKVFPQLFPSFYSWGRRPGCHTCVGLGGKGLFFLWLLFVMVINVYNYNHQESAQQNQCVPPFSNWVLFLFLFFPHLFWQDFWSLDPKPRWGDMRNLWNSCQQVSWVSSANERNITRKEPCPLWRNQGFLSAELQNRSVDFHHESEMSLLDTGYHWESLTNSLIAYKNYKSYS